MSDRWSIYLDIEGFGALWESEDHRVIWSLGELMRAILRIGRRCYPDVPERLFAHQFGDGFIVVSDHHEKSLERCVTIAVAIMRHVAASGRFVRGAIGEGEMSDISGCYPKEVLGFLEDDHTICLEAGLMTITPVMGSALIRAVRTDKAAPRGPLLNIETSHTERLGPSVTVTKITSSLSSIDWVHTESDLLSTLQKRASLSSPSPNELEITLREYCCSQRVPEEWKNNVHRLLGVPKG